MWFSCKRNEACVTRYELMHAFNKKLGLLSSASAVFRIYTNTPRSVESDLPSAVLCRRLRKSCCIDFLQWAKLPSQLLAPTPGSHLTVPSFVPMQLCEWPHGKSHHRNNLSQWLSVAELWCRKINLLNKFWYQKAVHETAFMPLRYHCSDRNRLAAQ